MRGITLEEIAEATKIGVRSLRALEQEQFEKLPGGIFNKGFVRAYARFLGIDEEQAVADYLSASEDKDEESSTPDKKPGKALLVEKPQSRSEDAESPGPPWRVAGAIVLLAVLAAGGWYAYGRWRAQHEAAAALLSEAPAVATVVPQTPPAPDAAAQATPATSATPSATAPELTSAAPPPSAEKVGAEFVVVVHAVRDSWMKISADGKLVMAGEVLKASGQKEVRAQKEIVLTVGNAGGVEVSHNGRALASLGAENKTRTVTFTPEGVQQ